MFSPALMALVAAAGATAPSHAGGDALDRTGIRWVSPFAEAKKKAEAEQRLLLLKPIAFGTEKNGCW
jgi:hypothetical protein